MPGHDGAGSFSGQAWRYLLGFFPNVFVKHREKYDIESKPQEAETSRIDMSVLVSRTRAYCNLRILLN